MPVKKIGVRFEVAPYLQIVTHEAGTRNDAPALTRVASQSRRLQARKSHLQTAEVAPNSMNPATFLVLQ